MVIYNGLIWILLDIPPELLNYEKQLDENISDKGAGGHEIIDYLFLIIMKWIILKILLNSHLIMKKNQIFNN